MKTYLFYLKTDPSTPQAQPPLECCQLFLLLVWVGVCACLIKDLLIVCMRLTFFGASVGFDRLVGAGVL